MRIEAILNSIKNGQQIEEIILDNITLDEHSNVISILSTATKLKSFTIESSLLTGGFLGRLGTAIGQHKTLTEFALKECVFAVENFSAFTQGASSNKSLKKFELFLSILQDEEIANLLEGLMQNNQFSELVLDNCIYIGERTLSHIGKCMTTNTNLIYISIKNCTIEASIEPLIKIYCDLPHKIYWDVDGFEPLFSEANNQKCLNATKFFSLAPPNTDNQAPPIYNLSNALV